MTNPGFRPWWDSIAALDLPATEKAVLQALARHADWSTGGRAHPSVQTIRDETGLGERTIQRSLRSLACADEACGRDRCTHRGLIEEQRVAHRYTPTEYRILVSLPAQMAFDEVGLARSRHSSRWLERTGTDPYEHLYRRD